MMKRTRRQIAMVLTASAALAFVALPLLHSLAHVAGVRHSHGGVTHEHAPVDQFISREEFYAWLRAHPVSAEELGAEESTPEGPDASQHGADQSSPAHGQSSPEHLTLAVLGLAALVLFVAALPSSAPPRRLASRAPAKLLARWTSARGPPALA